MIHGPALTKHPLLFPAGGAVPSLKSSHECLHARIADVTGLLKHYKFDRHFFNQCCKAVDRKNYFNGSSEYQAYLHMLEEHPELVLKRPTAQKFVSSAALVEAGVLHVSPSYRDLCPSGNRRVAA